MTKREAAQEFDEKLEKPASTVIAMELVRHALDWLDYVPEREYTMADHAAIVKACRELYRQIRPLTALYIDGDPKR